MATWRWSYPYGTTDDATVLFDAAPADATCRWRAPYREHPVPRQVSVETADGAMRTYLTGQVGRLVVLRFAGLPAGSDAQATALWGWRGILRFLEEYALFGGRPFGFSGHDPAADELEVRYVRGVETFALAEGRYAGEIVLRKEIR